jgi:cell division protease FtsH
LNTALLVAATVLGVMVVALLVLVYLIIRSAQKNASSSSALLTKRPRVLAEGPHTTTFADVGGLEEAKRQLQEIVEFLRDKKRFSDAGARLPKGVLIAGPPGTGKTLLARAVAGEAGVPWFPISGPDFIETFVGIGAQRVRDLFEQSRSRAPCIVFIDEIDTIGRHRGLGIGGFTEEREQTLKQLLVEMDGFESNEGVILIAATNKAEALDPALLRPGRFDRTIELFNPNTDDRERIISVLSKHLRIAANVPVRRLAEATVGFSGADLSVAVNEAALSAGRQHRTELNSADFEWGVDRVRQRRRAQISIERVEDTRRIAIHEAGHLSADLEYQWLDKLESVSVHSPYQPAWFRRDGVFLPPVVDHPTAERTLAFLLAGRAAEEEILGTTSSLVELDAATATALAYQMVCRWGLSKSLGFVNTRLLEAADALFIESTGSALKDNAETSEIRGLLQTAYTEAQRHVKANREQILDWAAALVEHETLGPNWIRKRRVKMTMSDQRIGASEPDHRNVRGDADTPPAIDIGVITIKREELEAVLGVFPDAPPLYHLPYRGTKSHREYNIRFADAGGDASYQIAIIRQLDQGEGAAQSAARDLLEELSPSLILVVGIAGAIPHKDFTLGDVLVSSRVNDYSVRALTPGQEPAYRIGGGSIAASISGVVANLAARRDALGSWTKDLPRRPPIRYHEETRYKSKNYDWNRKLRESLEYHFEASSRTSPIWLDGVLGSHDALTKDPDVVIPWLTTARDLMGVEMEAAGVYRAVGDRCPMLAIRGFSDIIGFERDEQWTNYACETAAAFTRAFLRTRPVRPKQA